MSSPAFSLDRCDGDSKFWINDSGLPPCHRRPARSPIANVSPHVSFLRCVLVMVRGFVQETYARASRFSWPSVTGFVATP
jgi:hypothetical protein